MVHDGLPGRLAVRINSQASSPDGFVVSSQPTRTSNNQVNGNVNGNGNVHRSISASFTSPTFRISRNNTRYYPCEWHLLSITFSMSV